MGIMLHVLRMTPHSRTVTSIMPPLWVAMKMALTLLGQAPKEHTTLDAL